MSQEDAVANIKELAGDAMMLVEAAKHELGTEAPGFEAVFHLAGNLSKDEAQVAAAILAIAVAGQAAGHAP